jgi:hypothetical protein
MITQARFSEHENPEPAFGGFQTGRLLQLSADLFQSLFGQRVIR